MYDAVHMFARSVHTLNQTAPEIHEEPLLCDGVKKWDHGERLISYMKAVSGKYERGVTSTVKNYLC